MNDLNWEIRELPQYAIKEKMNKRKNKDEDDVNSISERYYGITFNDELLILLDCDLPEDRKRKTLIHELTHCYIGCYITHLEKTYDEEMVADIISNSFDIIKKIVEKYFKD